jgi:hypothetical protein
LLLRRHRREHARLSSKLSILSQLLQQNWGFIADTVLQLAVQHFLSILSQLLRGGVVGAARRRGEENRLPLSILSQLLPSSWLVASL